MKNRLQITLEDEAYSILNQQENKSQYIENLLLNKKEKSQVSDSDDIGEMLTFVISELADIKQQISGLSSNGRTVDFDSINLGSSPSEPARNKQDILSDIREIESEYAEKAEYCQDEKTLRELNEECQGKVSLLWQEYRELDKPKI